jgi:hypothetical protein
MARKVADWNLHGGERDKNKSERGFYEFVLNLNINAKVQNLRPRKQTVRYLHDKVF